MSNDTHDGSPDGPTLDFVTRHSITDTLNRAVSRSYSIQRTVTQIANLVKQRAETTDPAVVAMLQRNIDTETLYLRQYEHEGTKDRDALAVIIARWAVQSGKLNGFDVHVEELEWMFPSDQTSPFITHRFGG